ncbi:MAG TPA: hypothetical protein VGF31_15545, partial [Myxococcaceae bacterium]
MRAALPLAFLAVLLAGFTPEDEALDPTTLPGAVGVPPAEDLIPEAAVPPAVAPPSVPSRVKTPPLASVRPLSPAEDLLARAHRDGARYVVSGPEGEAALT